MVCTFFGHSDAPNDIDLILKTKIIELIENKYVETFYVGNNGRFDSIVIRNLKLIKQDHPYIDFAIVLAYLPRVGNDSSIKDCDTVYPEGIENIPPRFRINYRNKWMINNSDYAITYVKRKIGGAFTFMKLAETKGKDVINIAEYIT